MLSGLSAGAFAVFFSWGINSSKEKPNIEICPDKEGSFYFDWDTSDSYPEGKRILIWTRISNLSSLSNSIMEFNLSLPNQSELFSTIHIKPGEKYKFGEWNKNGSKTFPISEYHLKPIINLDPYKSVEGWVFFPNVPDLNGEIKGTFTVKTTRGSFTKHISIHLEKGLLR